MQRYFLLIFMIVEVDAFGECFLDVTDNVRVERKDEELMPDYILQLGFLL